jgi:endonuclease-3
MKALAAWAADKGEPPVARLARERNDPFAVLVGAMLSARARDATTALVVADLLDAAPTPRAIAAMSLPAVTAVVKPVGLYRQKARNLLALARILVDRYGGKVPADLAALTSLPGVGIKSANLVLGQAFGIPAICVDVHVHRIVNRWGLVATASPEKSEAALRRVVPERYWIPMNPMLVRFGQEVCLPRRPRCGGCPLGRWCDTGGESLARRPGPSYT